MSLLIAALISLFPNSVHGFYNTSQECDEVLRFPKIIGRNNSGYNTTLYHIQYNEVTGMTAVSALTNDPEKCPDGVLNCHFITVYSSYVNELLWHKVILNVEDNLILKFSQDGTKILFFTLKD